MAGKTELDGKLNKENNKYSYIVGIEAYKGLIAGAVLGFAIGSIQEILSGKSLNLTEIMNVLKYAAFGAVAGGGFSGLGASGALNQLRNPRRKK